MTLPGSHVACACHVSVASSPKLASLPLPNTIRGASDATEPDPLFSRKCSVSLPTCSMARACTPNASYPCANATLGVIKTASLAVNTIRAGPCPGARSLLVTSTPSTQVDRLLSNEGIDIDATSFHWVPYVVGPRTSINVAMDWTGFDADGQTTIIAIVADPPRPRYCRCCGSPSTPPHSRTIATEYEYQVLDARRRPASGHQGLHCRRPRFRRPETLTLSSPAAARAN